MRASNSFAHDRRLDDPTRALLTDSIRGRGAYPFSRRDLLRAGAAGLVGLGLPLAAPPGARADDPGPCGPFPNPNQLFSAGTNNKIQGLTVNPPVLQNGQLCVTGTNNTGSTLVLVWDIWNAPLA